MKTFVTEDRLAHLRKDSEVLDVYFTLVDGELLANKFGEYKLLKAANSFFRGILINGGLTEYTVEKSVKRVDTEETSKLRAPFAEQLKTFDTLWKEYKEAHLQEEFKELYVIDSDRVLTLDNIPNLDINFSLAEAWEGYLYTYQELKRFSKGSIEYEELPKYIQWRSKNEFKEKHNQVKAKFREKLGLPEEDELKVEVSEMEITIKRMKRGESENASSKEFDELLPQLVLNFLEAN